MGFTKCAGERFSLAWPLVVHRWITEIGGQGWHVGQKLLPCGRLGVVLFDAV